jgi:hypothetical protein
MVTRGGAVGRDEGYQLLVIRPMLCNHLLLSVTAMGALVAVEWKRWFQGTTAVGLLKGEFALWWAGKPVHWQLHMGCGKKRGNYVLLTLHHGFRVRR